MRFGIFAFIAAFICSAADAQENCGQILQGAPASNSVVATYKSLQTLNPQKGEYETTAAFEARKAAMAFPKMVFGSTPLRASLGHYDADTGTLTYTGSNILTAATFTLTPGFSHAYGLEEDANKTIKNFIGQNAFGVKTKVESINYDEYLMVFTKNFSIGTGDILTVSVPPDRAQFLRNNLDLIVAGSLQNPPIATDTHYSGATIDLPIQTSGKSYLVMTDGVCVGLRDRTNHQILASYAL